MNIKIITNNRYQNIFSLYDKNFFSDVLTGTNLDRKTLKDFIKDAEVLLLASESVMPFDKELIDAAKHVKYISIEEQKSSTKNK